VSRKIFNSLIKLNENIPSDAEKVNTLRKLADDTKSKMFDNSVQVRDKLSDFIENRPFTPAEQKAFDN